MAKLYTTNEFLKYVVFLLNGKHNSQNSYKGLQNNSLQVSASVQNPHEI